MTAEYQAGYKLRDLKQFIEETVGPRIAQRLECEMSKVSLELTTKSTGHGFDMLVQHYEAEFYFDKFPFTKYDPAVLFSNVAAWLMDNDGEREYDDDLLDPEVEVTTEDETNAEILINVAFKEPIKVIEDPEGLIHWRGKRWSVQQYDVHVATNLLSVTAKSA